MVGDPSGPSACRRLRTGQVRSRRDYNRSPRSAAKQWPRRRWHVRLESTRRKSSTLERQDWGRKKKTRTPSGCGPEQTGRGRRSGRDGGTRGIGDDRIEGETEVRKDHRGKRATRKRSGDGETLYEASGARRRGALVDASRPHGQRPRAAGSPPHRRIWRVARKDLPLHRRLAGRAPLYVTRFGTRGAPRATSPSRSAGRADEGCGACSGRSTSGRWATRTATNHTLAQTADLMRTARVEGFRPEDSAPVSHGIELRGGEREKSQPFRESFACSSVRGFAFSSLPSVGPGLLILKIIRWGPVRAADLARNVAARVVARASGALDSAGHADAGSRATGSRPPARRNLHHAHHATTSTPDGCSRQGARPARARLVSPGRRMRLPRGRSACSSSLRQYPPSCATGGGPFADARRRSSTIRRYTVVARPLDPASTRGYRVAERTRPGQLRLERARAGRHRRPLYGSCSRPRGVFCPRPVVKRRSARAAASPASGGLMPRRGVRNAVRSRRRDWLIHRRPTTTSCARKRDSRPCPRARRRHARARRAEFVAHPFSCATGRDAAIEEARSVFPDDGHAEDLMALESYPPGLPRTENDTTSLTRAATRRRPDQTAHHSGGCCMPSPRRKFLQDPPSSRAGLAGEALPPLSPRRGKGRRPTTAPNRLIGEAAGDGHRREAIRVKGVE